MATGAVAKFTSQSISMAYVQSERIVKLVKLLDKAVASGLIGALIQFPEEVMGDLDAIEKEMRATKYDDGIRELLDWYNRKALIISSGFEPKPPSLVEKSELHIFKKKAGGQ